MHKHVTDIAKGFKHLPLYPRIYAAVMDQLDNARNNAWERKFEIFKASGELPGFQYQLGGWQCDGCASYNTDRFAIMCTICKTHRFADVYNTNGL